MDPHHTDDGARRDLSPPAPGPAEPGRPVFRPGEVRSPAGTPTIGVGSGALRPNPPRPHGEEWRRLYGVDGSHPGGLRRVWRTLRGRGV